MLPDLYRQVVGSVEELNARKSEIDRLWAEFTRSVLASHPEPPLLLIVSTDSGPKLYRVANRSLEYIPPHLIATVDAQSGTVGMSGTDHAVRESNNNREEVVNGDLREARESTEKPDPGLA